MTDPLQRQWDAFLEAMKVRGYSPATLTSYRSALAVFGAFLGQRGIGDVREVTSSTLQDYQRFLQSRHHAGWTVLARMQAVRRFYDHLERTQAVLLNPCVGLSSPRIGKRLPKTVLSVEEASKVIESLDPTTAIGMRDRAILEVFYTCGVRLAEMARLLLSDIDLVNGFLRLNRGKGGRDRVVPLGRRAVECLRRYLEEARQKWSPPQRNEQALWLGAKPPHGPLKSQAIAVMVKHRGREAGLSRRLTPHVWRHTCATHLVASGASVAYVQRLLGHESLRTTQVYVRTTIREVQETHTLAHPRNLETTR